MSASLRKSLMDRFNDLASRGKYDQAEMVWADICLRDGRFDDPSLLKANP